MTTQTLGRLAVGSIHAVRSPNEAVFGHLVKIVGFDAEHRDWAVVEVQKIITNPGDLVATPKRQWVVGLDELIEHPATERSQNV